MKSLQQASFAPARYPAENLLDGPRVQVEFIGFRPEPVIARNLKSALRRYLRRRPWSFRVKVTFIALCGGMYQVTAEARCGLQYGHGGAYGSKPRDLLKKALESLRLVPDDDGTEERPHRTHRTHRTHSTAA